jgi:hypothetical protein
MVFDQKLRMQIKRLFSSYKTITDNLYAAQSICQPKAWRHDTQYNGTQYNDTQHNDTQHNAIKHNGIQHNDTKHDGIQHNGTKHDGIQHNDTKHNNKKNLALSITTLNAYTECHYAEFPSC